MSHPSRPWLLRPDDGPPERAEALAALRQAPSGAGLGLAAGLLAAAIVPCGIAASNDNYGPAILCSPLLVGAIVGLLTDEHPIRNALVAVLFALFAGVLAFQESAFYCLFLLPLVVPEMILGSTCGWTIRRHVRGRRARAAIGGLLRLDDAR